VTTADGATTPQAHSRDSSLGYRPALDGIRAVAVLAVIAYHLGYGRARGGFLGVDVFFVLSGYLITSLLLAERARTGAIDFAAFWFRRARRLLPALFLMLIAVAFWVGASTAAFELQSRRDDILWTLFYGANWHFIATGQDYFDQFASASPLRHTWSLAIEEQFYVAWPLIVGAALWLGRRREAVVAGVCVVGIAVSAAAMALLYDPGDPSRAYYGTDARMHELLVGALLAVLMFRYAGSRAMRLAGAAAVPLAVGAGLLLLASFTLVSDTSVVYYRGLSLGLAVTVAVLIFAVEREPGGLPARLLSLRPVAWVGQISYGLYLWHWPVTLAILKSSGPFRLLPGSLALNGERVAITFAIAVASFYLLEQPIRRGKMPVLGPSRLRFAIAAVAAIVLVSGTAFWQTSAASPLLGRHDIDCPNFTSCVRHRSWEGDPVVAVIGDSIARSMDPAVLQLARVHRWTYVLDGSSACRITSLQSSKLGVVRPIDKGCTDNAPAAEKALLDAWHPRVVIIIDRSERSDIFIDGRTVAGGSAEHRALVLAGLTDWARGVTTGGTKVVFLEQPDDIPLACFTPDKLGAPECRIQRGSDRLGAEINSIYREVAATVRGVVAIDLTDEICPDGICAPVVNGLMLRYDGIHFSQPGAVRLAPIFYERMAAAGVLP
jgi:peptidoglycan/LPS O-acetylase OafA/YrhL